MDVALSHQLELTLSHARCTEPRKKILRRFYEPLILLEALGRARPAPIRDFAEVTSTGIAGLRRSFVDGITYLCAAERHPGRVTAAALQKTPQGPVLWLAANDGVEMATMSFAEEILQTLNKVSSHSATADRLRVAEDITPPLLRRVIAFNAPRLRKYVRNVRNVDVRCCIQLLRQHPAQGACTICPDLVIY